MHKALKQRDEEITRTSEVAEQAQRRADYMEEMLDKQNKLLRERKLKKWYVVIFSHTVWLTQYESYYKHQFYFDKCIIFL